MKSRLCRIMLRSFTSLTVRYVISFFIISYKKDLLKFTVARLLFYESTIEWYSSLVSFMTGTRA